MMNIEQTILNNLIYNEEYSRQVFPFLKYEYFNNAEQIIFLIIKNFVIKYNKFPVPKSIAIELMNLENISEENFNQCKEILVSFKKDIDLELQWLVDETENFCKEKALHNALREAILIVDGKDEKKSKGLIPQLITDALGVSFDNSVGHDYFEDAAERWDFFHTSENKIPFRIEFFNRITKKGLKNKTLNIFIAGPGVGKSLFMCNLAADNLLIGKNVLYITLEMSQEEIANRIDANMLDMTLEQVDAIDKEKYLKLLNRVKDRSGSKLVVQEYPVSSASVIHFKHLVSELKIKKNFKPDIIYVDYLGICASSRLKLSNQVNSYAVMKAVSEELRGWAKECVVPVVSAVQFNREGFKSSEPGMGETSESFGIPFTADLMLALITSDELEQLGQIMVKQLKNRYNDLNRPNKFVLGIDKSKMKLYDLEESAQRRVLDGDKEEKIDKEIKVSDYLVKPKFDKTNMFEDFK